MLVIDMICRIEGIRQIRVLIYTKESVYRINSDRHQQTAIAQFDYVKIEGERIPELAVAVVYKISHLGLTRGTNIMFKYSGIILSIILSSFSEIGKPVEIILDTDIGPDCDDAGAIAVLNVLADKGEANILGLINSSLVNDLTQPTS